MGDVARHLAQIADQRADPVEHRIEDRGKAIELVIAADRHPSLQPPDHDRPCGLRHRLQSAAQIAAEQQRTDDAQHRHRQRLEDKQPRYRRGRRADRVSGRGDEDGRAVPQPDRQGACRDRRDMARMKDDLSPTRWLDRQHRRSRDPASVPRKCTAQQVRHHVRALRHRPQQPRAPVPPVMMDQAAHIVGDPLIDLTLNRDVKGMDYQRSEQGGREQDRGGMNQRDPQRRRVAPTHQPLRRHRASDSLRRAPSRLHRRTPLRPNACATG